jgi:hypothetical protein
MTVAKGRPISGQNYGDMVALAQGFIRRAIWLGIATTK